MLKHVQHDEKGRGPSRGNFPIALALKFERQFGPARADDAPASKDMDEIRFHVIEQALIMGDQQHRLVGRAHDAVDAVADRAQRIDVEAAVGFVEDGELRGDDPHLDHFGALLLAARKADIDRTLEHFGIETECRRLGAGKLKEVAARQRAFTASPALRVERFAQELHVGYPGNLDRILETEEQPGGGALVRRKGEEVDRLLVIASGAKQSSLTREQADALGMSMDMMKRNVNVGFSGGEKKRNEMVQMALIDPRLAVLDETDSGLDIDALRVVGDGINRIMRRPDKAVLLITHYQRLLDLVVPDYVHVLAEGRITRSGGPELAHQLEREGYAQVAA